MDLNLLDKIYKITVVTTVMMIIFSYLNSAITVISVAGMTGYGGFLSLSGQWMILNVMFGVYWVVILTLVILSIIMFNVRARAKEKEANRIRRGEIEAK